MRALGEEVSQLPELPIDVKQVILEYISRTFDLAEVVITTARLAQTSQSWKEALKTQDKKNWEGPWDQVNEEISGIIGRRERQRFHFNARRMWLATRLNHSSLTRLHIFLYFIFLVVLIAASYPFCDKATPKNPTECYFWSFHKNKHQHYMLAFVLIFPIMLILIVGLILRAIGRASIYCYSRVNDLKRPRCCAWFQTETTRKLLGLWRVRSQIEPLLPVSTKKDNRTEEESSPSGINQPGFPPPC